MRINLTQNRSRLFKLHCYCSWTQVTTEIADKGCVCPKVDTIRVHKAIKEADQEDTTGGIIAYGGYYFIKNIYTHTLPLQLNFLFLPQINAL